MAGSGEPGDQHSIGGEPSLDLYPCRFPGPGRLAGRAGHCLNSCQRLPDIPYSSWLMSGQERGLCAANPCSSVSPELIRDPPTPETENLVAGLKSGLTLSTPNA